MHWLLLLLALIAFGYALTVTSALAMLACMLLALLLGLGWMIGLYRSRFARQTSDLTTQAALMARRSPVEQPPQTVRSEHPGDQTD